MLREDREENIENADFLGVGGLPMNDQFLVRDVFDIDLNVQRRGGESSYSDINDYSDYYDFYGESEDGYFSTREQLCDLTTPLKQFIFAAIEDERLKDLKAVINQVTLELGFDSVYHAVFHKQRKAAKLIIDEICAVGENNYGLFEFMKRALDQGADEVVRLLLDEGIKVDEEVKFELIHTAVARQHVQIVKHLLTYGVDANFGYSCYGTILHEAVRHGNMDIVKLLLKYGADINATRDESTHGSTALHLATMLGFVEIAEHLIQEGADMHAVGPFEINGFSYGRFHDHECGCSSQRVEAKRGDSGTPFKVAVQNHHLKMIKMFLKNGIEVDTLDSEGYTALQHAVLSKCPNVIMSILENHPNVKCENNKTAYLSAIKLLRATSTTNVVAALEQSGFVLDTEKLKNDTDLLYKTVCHDLYNVTKSLLQHGAHINVTYHTDETYFKFFPSLLHIAVERRNKNMVQLLLDFGANPDVKNQDGKTPLFFAIVLSQVAIVKILMASGAENFHDDLMIIFAAANLDVRFVRLLVEEKGFDTDRRASGDQMKIALPSFHDVFSSVDFQLGLIFDHLDDTSSQYAHLYNFISGPQTAFGTLHGSFSHCLEVTPLSISSRVGRLDTVKFLLRVGAKVNAADKIGVTALHEAAYAGHSKVVELLLEYGADIDVVSGVSTPFSLSVCKNHWNTVEILLKSGADVQKNEERQGIFADAMKSDAPDDVIKLLLEKGFKYTRTHGFGSTVLNYIDKHKLHMFEPILNSHENIPEEDLVLLLDRAVEINSERMVGSILKTILRLHGFKTKYNQALLISAANGNLKITKMLMRSGADVHFFDCQGYTALHRAIEHNRKNIIHFLLKNGAAVNSPSGSENYKTFFLLKSGAAVNSPSGSENYKTFFLLQNGAAVNSPSGSENHTTCYLSRTPSPLSMAARKGFLEVVKTLIEFGANINALSAIDSSPIFEACKKGRFKVAQLLLQHGATPDSKFDDETPLSICAQKGYLSVLQILIKFNSAVDIADSRGRTPLYKASEQGHVRIVKKLLKSGAATDVRTQCGETPLSIAATNGHLKTVKILLKFGAAIDIIDTKGNSALFKASSNGHIKVVRLLLKHGAKTDTKNTEKETPLSIAVSNNHLNVVEELLKAVVNIGMEESAAIHHAVRNNQSEIVELLLHHGADVNVQNSKGMTPLMNCTRLKSVQIFEILLKHNAAIELQDKAGKTVLHYAVMARRNGEMIKLLLELGANVDARDKKGQTPLFGAVLKEKLSTMQTLLEAGADINAADESGETPLATAMTNLESEGNEVKVLLDFGASIQSVSGKLEPRHHLNGCAERHILRHAIKLKAANLHEVEEILATLAADRMIFLDSDMHCYKYEVVEMKYNYIGDTNTTYYQILTKNSNELVSFTKNTEAVKYLRTPILKKKYPIYGDMVDARIKKAVHRRDLVQQGLKWCSIVFYQYGDIPFDTIEKVLEYLNNTDLRVLIHACKPLKSKFDEISFSSLSLERLDLFDY